MSYSLFGIRGLLALGLATVAGCASKKPEVGVAPVESSSPVNPAPAPPPVVVPPDTVRIRDVELEQRAQRLELTLLERDAQIDELQTRLDETRQEVVRAMAKLQTLATKAEAASGLAEAEVAVQSLRAAGGQRATSELAQATKLLQQSSAEFNKQNYAGSLYLATQTKRLAGAAKGRLNGTGSGARPGEATFTTPVRLQAVHRSNVREGPGTSFKVLFTMEAGTSVTGYSYTDNWIRVTAEDGRSGWVMRNLVGRGPEAMR
jgi:uncharacterized coiled-coil protein SlyX